MVISGRNKKFSLSARFLILLLDTRQDFLIMSNLYLVEIFSEPNSPTIITNKKIRKTSNYFYRHYVAENV